MNWLPPASEYTAMCISDEECTIEMALYQNARIDHIEPLKIIEIKTQILGSTKKIIGVRE